MPIATIRPATPGSESRYPCSQESSAITPKVRVPATRRLATVISARPRYWSSEYSTTRTRPISPASSPRSSCSLPSVAEICSSDCTVKLIGSEPKFSWLASVAASSWLNPLPAPPVIVASPLRMGSSTPGAETTSVSRTMPNWF